MYLYIFDCQNMDGEVLPLLSLHCHTYLQMERFLFRPISLWIQHFKTFVNFINDDVLDTEELMPHKRGNAMLYTRIDPAGKLDSKFQTRNAEQIMPIVMNANWLSTILMKSVLVPDDQDDEEEVDKTKMKYCVVDLIIVVKDVLESLSSKVQLEDKDVTVMCYILGPAEKQSDGAFVPPI